VEEESMLEGVAFSIADAILAEWKAEERKAADPCEQDPRRPYAVLVTAELNRPARDELQYLRRVYGDDTLRIVRRHQDPHAKVARTHERTDGAGFEAARQDALEAA
jgi:hypothetical protein